MRAYFAGAVWTAAFELIVLCSGGNARADSLVMPYRCTVAGGTIALSPSAPQTYAIQGSSDARSFSACGLDDGGNTACTTVMVHRFTVACAGGEAQWSHIARSAAPLGVALPPGLPEGYAPISALQGRIVLPPQARFSGYKDAVTSEPLAEDGVTERINHDAAPERPAQAWTTIVKAEFNPQASGQAARIAGILAVFLGAFLVLGLIAARRPLPDAVLDGRAGMFALKDNLMRRLHRVFCKLRPVNATPSATAGDRQSLLNGVSIANARLAEAELLVASLGHSLVVRGVLQAELEAVRRRLEVIAQGIAAQPVQKSAAHVRTVLRELDRITRMAQGAVSDRAAAPEGTGPQAAAMPESLQDAYRVLGINGDVSPNVAKKLVDALRMTWHPDFARGEEDRRMREVRMKQINAAWDMIKGRMAQAA